MVYFTCSHNGGLFGATHAVISQSLPRVWFLPVQTVCTSN